MNNINEVGYNGNPLLKKTNTPIPWTQEQIDEYIKCKDDPEYFAEKYIKIITEDGFEVIELYDYQKEIIDKFDKNKKLAVLQARQSGKCVEKDTTVNIRNKHTGEIMKMKIGEFFELQRK